MIKGKIVAFEGSGLPLLIQEHELRNIEPEEILVKVQYTTLCGSDLHTYCGLRAELTPTVLGHEITGAVVQIGEAHAGIDFSGEPLSVGDRLTWSVFASDPQSRNALMGIPQKGEGLFKYGHARIAGNDIFHGGLAEYCILKKGTAVFKLPTDMPLPVAATINCAVATVAGAIRVAGNIMKDKVILVTGIGLLGINCIAMCKKAGAARIIVADIDDARLQHALLFGADEIINLSAKNSLKPGADIVFDMSGSPEAMEFGINTLNTGGTAVWVGAVFKTTPVPVNPEYIIRNMLSIKGLHNYNYEDLQSAVRFMSASWQEFPFENIVAKEFSLAETKDAFEYAVAYKPLRVGIRI